jgi:Caudovirus prohead serine protease
MGAEAKPDFSGWATKAGLKCSDGRVIMPDAFKHQDTHTVPLVWQHNHNEPSNVLGHAILENREDGVYAYAFFNGTEQAKNAKTLVEHGDIKSLSIYANQLTEKSKQVLHGFIRELSLVLSGANPGALIDNITLAHGDGEMVVLDDEAIIYTGLELAHVEEDSTEEVEHADEDEDEGPTIQDVYDGMSDEEKDVVHYMVGAALEAQENEALAQSSDSDEATTDVEDESASELVHTDDKNEEEGRHMTRNVFEQQNGGKKEDEHVLSHDAIKGIVQEAHKIGSLKEAVENYAFQHGIENIEVLFPDARSITDTPEFDQRRVEWVSNVMNGTRHSPFSRIKSLVADITFDEARARGYIKGNLKKEEWFGVSKRLTTPTTVYKKQKLDRDDIIDITDFDVVVWLKAEMRLMLDEEIARAILIGDGRDIADEDKIKDPRGAAEGAGIRSILYDHDLYAATVTVDDAATSLQTADAIVTGMGFYKGSGSPTFYTTLPVLTSLMLTREPVSGQRYWRTAADLAAEMGVKSIETVEVMENEPDLVGIIVNLRDYTLGADKGGDVTLFDDFDIDYNQYKYLLETRLSGALTKIRSAIVIKRAATGGTLSTPTEPGFVEATGVVTIPTVTGVVYKNKGTGATLTAGAQTALAPGAEIVVEAVPASGYYFASNQDDQWTFERP